VGRAAAGCASMLDSSAIGEASSRLCLQAGQQYKWGGQHGAVSKGRTAVQLGMPDSNTSKLFDQALAGALMQGHFRNVWACRIPQDVNCVLLASEGRQPMPRAGLKERGSLKTRLHELWPTIPDLGEIKEQLANIKPH
jgi:hypothetical protein